MKLPLIGRAKRKLQNQKLKTPIKDGDRFKILDNWMYMDDKDSMQLTKNGLYNYKQTQIIKKLVKKKHTVLDIGANIGYFTLIMAKQAKQVYAFEPEARNFHILKKKCRIKQVIKCEIK